MTEQGWVADRTLLNETPGLRASPTLYLIESIAVGGAN
jgi:hypothetical protein